MKRLLVISMFALLLIGILGVALTIAESNETGSSNGGNRSNDNSNMTDDSDDLNETDDSGNDSMDDLDDSNETEVEDDDSDDSNKTRFRERYEEKMKNGEWRVKYELRDGDNRIMYKLRERLEDSREEIKLRIKDRNMTFNYTDDDKLEILLGRINVKTGLNLTVDDLDNVTLGQVLRAYLSNGRWAEVKVMPDTASETALKRLRAKCEERNCSVELREIHNNKTNVTRIAYEVKTEKDSRLFFLFKKKMLVRAEVDAETGEIIKAEKPWWAFVAKEKNADDSEIEAEVESESKG